MSSTDLQLLIDKLTSKALAWTKFYKVSLMHRPLQEPFEECILLISPHQRLIEYIDGKLERTKEVPYKSVQKLIVHLEFEPVTHYIVILCDNKASLLSYENLEPIHEWENIKTFKSADEEGCGKPTLRLQLLNGKWIPIKLNEFIPTTFQQEDGKVEAATALANSFKNNLRMRQNLQMESASKEAFIRRSLAEYKLAHHGFNHGQSFSEGTLDKDMQSSSSYKIGAPKVTDTKVEKPSLKVLSTRHRVFNNKWIICATIQNDSNKHIVKRLQVTLTPSNETNKLHYYSKVLKVSRKACTSDTSLDSEPFVEELIPAVLRPGKRAFLFAVCTMPEFTSNFITCSGLVSYEIREVHPSDGNESQKGILFASLSKLELSPSTIHDICIDFHKRPMRSGFSFEVLALMAASQSNSFVIRSHLAPLEHVSECLTKASFIKVSDSENFYYFWSKTAHPLNYVLLSLHQTSSQTISALSHTKDDSQAILLARMLTSLLPKDTTLEPDPQTRKNSPSLMEFATKINECLTFINDASKKGGEYVEGSGKKLKKANSCGELADPKIASFDEEAYNEWRKSLNSLQESMDKLSIQLQTNS